MKNAHADQGDKKEARESGSEKNTPPWYRTKALSYVISVLVLSGIMVYVETQLTFFRRFLPVGDNKFFIALANLYFLVILLFAFLAARIILKTYIEKKRGIWGSGLKTKLTVTIFSASLISSACFFILTTWFFSGTIDTWVSDKVEETVESAQVLSRFYYEDLFSRYEKMGLRISESVASNAVLDNDKALLKFVRREGKSNFVSYLAVLDLEGRVRATYSDLDEDMTHMVTERARTFEKGKDTRDILPNKTGDIFILFSPIFDDAGEVAALLFIGEKIKVPGTQRMKQINKAYAGFVQDSRSFKKVLKYGLLIPLMLVAVLSIFMSTWIGIKMATQITVPLKQMREGADVLAKGSFDVNLEDHGRDEIGTLVSGFNRMAKELKVAKDEIEEKRRYMEVILDNVATGIITTDTKGNVLLLNRAAREILRINADNWVNVPLKSLIGVDFRTVVRPFLQEIRSERAGSGAEEMTISLQNDALHLRTSLTVLRDEAGLVEGYIGTFDDITHIMRAEKLATWREIAKRLTHEIKNPLTPIKLSAERIRRRILPDAEGKDKQVLEEATTVILNASNDITTMVNELNKLSETSTMRSPGDINGVIEETFAMYQGLFPNIAFSVQLGRVPVITMDRDKMKRAFINMVSNSIAAIGSDEGTITATSRYDSYRNAIWIELADTGPGIRDEDKARVFDPYFSRNPNGTGLGLAIVNSIILEHGGRINVEDAAPIGASTEGSNGGTKGTKMVIELPVLEA
jgi:two-component system, NtrC family, nitrogen regulation sensor histidine kinase NtrY